MLDKDIIKHARELRRVMRNNKHEFTTDGGIMLPGGATIKGAYVHSVNGEDERWDDNLITNEGVNYMLDAAVLGSASALSSWYIALWSANVVPSASSTAADFATTYSEITSGTDGYAESTRLAFNATRTADGVVDNLTSRADFTIATPDDVVIAGAAVLSESAKGATTGTLLSIAKFSQARTQYDGDIFSVGYKLMITPA